jgi:uncharacterized damage-inducible protein DinB
MDTNAFRHFFGYHFAENRTLWDNYITALTDEQFTQSVGYSHGSVRDQLVHLMSVDETWFCGLRGAEIPAPLNPADFASRQAIRTYWDGVELRMHAYLADLHDEMLVEKPFADDEDKDLTVWQVLLQVVNHATDHRAQMLRLLHDLGVKTVSQDYIFYVYANPSTHPASTVAPEPRA